MKTIILVLLIVYILLSLINRAKKNKSNTSTSQWKPDKNARMKSYDNSGRQVNPRTNSWAATKSGKIIKVKQF